MAHQLKLIQCMSFFIVVESLARGLGALQAHKPTLKRGIVQFQRGTDREGNGPRPARLRPEGPREPG